MKAVLKAVGIVSAFVFLFSASFSATPVSFAQQSNFVFTRNLTIGISGADVSALQQFLITNGFLHTAAPTGYFGPLTQSAVIAWQGSVGLPSTGFFGALSRAAIGSGAGAGGGTGSGGTGGTGGTGGAVSGSVFTRSLTIGDTGTDVSALQQFLITKGFLHAAAPTEYFGVLTQAAVAAWQAVHGLPSTGFFGALSRAEIALELSQSGGGSTGGSGTSTTGGGGSSGGGGGGGSGGTGGSSGGGGGGGSGGSGGSGGGGTGGGGGGTGGGGGGSDTTLPTATVTAPAANATVAGSAIISATASDDVAVASVQFSVDGIAIGIPITAAPYQIFWNTLTATNGVHTLRAIARDTSGNVGNSPTISVTVNNAPTITVTAPVNGATISGTTLLFATATSSVASVQFVVDGLDFGPLVTLPPYQVFWNTVTAANGAHTIRAKAVDTGGNQSISPLINVTVNNVVQTLTASLGSSVTSSTAPLTVTLTATAGGTAAGTINYTFYCNRADTGTNITSPSDLSVVGTSLNPYSAVNVCTYAIAGTYNAKVIIERGSAPAAQAQKIITVSAGGGGGGGGDTTPPSIPSGLTKGTITTSTAAFSWTASTDNVGIAGYKIYRGGVQIATNAGTGTSFTNTGLSASTTYSFQVAAYDAAGNTSGLSGPLSITTNALPDLTAPTATLTAPANNSTVSGSVTVSATASDNVGVASVQFSLDGLTLGAPVTAAPYQVFWNTVGASNGAHTLRAIATDLSGNVGNSQTVSVTVANGGGGGGGGGDTTAPSIPTSLIKGAVTTSTAVFSWTASTDNVGVAGYKIYRGGVQVATSAGLGTTFTNTGLSASTTYSFQVSAYDAAGNTSGLSSALSITTNGIPDVTNPTATMTAPAASSTVSGSVTVSATASDNVGVASVQFMLDGAALGSLVAVPPYQVSWNTASASNGAHTLRVVATDLAGNTGTSQTISVTVSNGAAGDTTPPTTQITAPAAGATISGSAVSVTATAADNVGVTKVEFYVDGTLKSTDTTSPYNFTLDTTVLSNGSHSLSTKAYDAAGNTGTSASVSVTVSNVTGASGNIYIAQTAAGIANGSNCSNAYALSFFNTAGNWGAGATQIGAGDTVHLCGTVTMGANTNALTFQGDGTSGSPITLLFEPGAVLQSPQFKADGGGTGCGGAVCIYNRNWVVVDGGTNGIIRNTDNGDALGHDAASAGIDGYKCNNCTVKNLSILNMIVKSTTGTGAPGDQVHTITMSGSHWSVHDTVDDNCGWCIFENFANGDTDIDIYNNNISHMDHGWMFAASAANSATGPIKFHDNQVHDTSNWDTAGCAYHHDGIHTFGVPGSSFDGLYIYGNYFYGNWGTCPTGFIYIENGSSNPSHAKSWAVFNNVGIVGAGSGLNTNGWFGLFSGESGTQKVFNNTIIGPNNTDNSICFSIQSLSGLSFEDNTVSNCGDPVGISNSTVVAANYNFYGTSCGNGNNCFVWNNSFKGSFAAWKTACGCDANGVQNNNPLLNSDGSPQAGSPLLGVGTNLTSFATGNLSTLAFDTTKGHTRTAVARPGAGAWDAGAYYVGGAPADTIPPTASITAPANGASVSGTSVPVSVTAADNVGVTKVEVYVDGTLNATDNAAPYTFTLDATALANGSHTLSAKAYDAAQNVGTSPVVSITVTGNAAGLSANFFGLNVHDTVSPWPSLANPPTTFGAVRLWDSATRWNQLETASGTFNWTTLDNMLAAARANGQDVLYTFGGVPHWISSDPTDTTNCGELTPPGPNGGGTCQPPVDVNADGTGTDATFKGFVTALMAHLQQTGQSIQIFEPWNEINNKSFWMGNAKQLLRMAYDARTIIKTSMPSAIVLTPDTCNCDNTQLTSSTVTTTSPQDGMNYYLTTSLPGPGGSTVTGASIADGIAFHTYLGSTNPENIVNLINKMRVVMQNDGVGNLPLYDTESSWGKNAILTGCTTNPPFTQTCIDNAAIFLTRSYILVASNNVARFYWYQWGNVGYGTIYDPTTGSVLSAATGYNAIENWLTGASFTAPCSLNGTIYSCSIRRPGGYQGLIAWDTSASCSNGSCTSTPYTPGGIYTQYQTLQGGSAANLSGGSAPIGAKPILIEN